MISSFTDPMTRQLSEAVRIELRGPEILNSKSEYTRCRVPRLRVDLEGWKLNQNREGSKQDEAQLNEEAESSLQEEGNKKRKKDQEEEGGKISTTLRKSKRRKLEPLVGWGESTSLQGGLGQETIPEGWKDNKEFSGTGEQDINITCSRMKQVTLPLRWKVDNITATEGIQLKESSDGIGDEDKESEGKGIMEEQPRLESTMDVENIGVDKDDVPRGWIRTEKKSSKTEFKFKKRGKLNKREVCELKKTHRSLFGWLSKERSTDMTDEDPMEWEDHGREEKLERARLRKLEWASTAMMKKVVVELLEGAVGKVESRHCEKIVLEMVDRAWEDGEVNRIMDIIGEAGKSVQERIEKSLSTNRRE